MCQKRKRQNLSVGVFCALMLAPHVVGAEVVIDGGIHLDKIYGSDELGNQITSDDVIEHKLIINTGTFKNKVYGGNAIGGNAANNSIYIKDGIFYDDIRGAYGNNNSADGFVSHNSVTIDNCVLDKKNSNVVGGEAFKGDASHNSVIIKNGDFKVFSSTGYGIFGGKVSSFVSDGNADNNLVQILNGSFDAEVYGGKSTKGNADNNQVIISGGKFYREIYGSDSGKDACGNRVEISGGIFDGKIYAAKGKNNVSGNVLELKGDTVIKGNVYGAQGTSYKSTEVYGNKIIIDGATIKKDVYAYSSGYSKDGAEANKIILKSGNLRDANLAGRDSKAGKSKSSLVIDGFSGKIKNIKKFDTLEFDQVNWKNGTTVIEVLKTSTGNELANTKINLNKISFAGGDVVEKEESMTLIKDSTEYGLAINMDNVTESPGFTAGVAVQGEGQASLEDGNLIYTIKSKKAANQTSLVVENRAVAVAFVNQGTNLISDSLGAISNDGTYGVKTFAAVHGNRSEYDVNSNLKINGWSTIVGVGSEKQLNKGDFSWGVFYENGSGNYRTYNSFNDEFFRGDGNLVYNGGGVAARYENNNGVYTEGSMRVGMLKNEMTNALKDGLGNSYGYKSESDYYGAHIGVGRVYALSQDREIDLYGKFFHTYTDGDSFTVADDKFLFDSITSNRLSIGARILTNKDDKLSAYYGLAYEYEFNGDTKMKAQNISAPTKSLQGSSYMAELGIVYRPEQDSPWSFDLKTRGYLGAREGFSGNIQANYNF